MDCKKYRIDEFYGQLYDDVMPKCGQAKELSPFLRKNRDAYILCIKRLQIGCFNTTRDKISVVKNNLPEIKKLQKKVAWNTN